MQKADPPASPSDELDRLRARVAELEARLAERRTGHPEADLPAARFSQVFRSSPAAVLITRVDGDQVLDVNESFLRMCGLAREEVIGRSAQALWKDPTHRDDMLVTIAEFGSVHDVEASIRSSGGEFRRGRVSAEVLELGSDRCLIWQIVDITDAKRTELALRRTRERYRSLTDDVLDNAPVGIFLLDSEFRVVWINQPVERYFGLRREEILGQDKRRIVREHMRDVLQDPEEFQARVLGAYERGRHIEGIECRVRAGDKREDRWLRYWSQPIRTGLYAGGRLEQYTDITERKQLEGERRRYAQDLEAEVARRTEELEQAIRKLRGLQGDLIHAQGLRAAEDLAANVAHAITNPLAALIGTVEMGIETRSPIRPRLKRVLELAWRIKHVVDHTLALFRDGVLNLRPESPVEILDELRAALLDRARAQGVSIELRVQPDLPRLEVDRPLLHSALLGIAENALDAMPNGGRLSLGGAALPGAEVLALAIGDSGPGIPSDLRERVLDPFFSTKAGGTGLGLAIAQGVIRGHKGRLRIEGQAGAGTRVIIELPMRRARPVSRSQPAPDPSQSARAADPRPAPPPDRP